MNEALNAFLAYYRVHKLDHTYVYEGVFAALESLRTGPDGRERQMAVLSNKPVNPSRDICKALGLSPYFFQIYGGNSFHTKKPDPTGLNTLIEEAGVSSVETVMIGDSENDTLTARNAGTWSIGCTFGLAPQTLTAIPPDITVDSPSDWTLAIEIEKMAR